MRDKYVGFVRHFVADVSLAAAPKPPGRRVFSPCTVFTPGVNTVLGEKTVLAALL